ncbi:MAG: HD domain-containing protein [Desulfuromonadales bacterium]|nr:HD domain-containing protein [Desulfuromonadales bacterium]
MESQKIIDRPLYNSRIIDSYIRLIKQKYSHVNISELLEYAGMKEYQVADQAHWFTQEQINRFYEKLVQVTGNTAIAREAGLYAASPDAIGAMRQYILGLVGASNAFELLSKATENFTRSSRYESRKLSSNRVEVIVTPLEEGLEKSFQCENRIGFFEAIVTIFNKKENGGHRLPEVQHPECMFKGGKVCRYVITWEKSLSVMLKRLLGVVTVALVILNLVLLLTNQWSELKFIFPVSIFIVLILVIAADKSENSELKKSLNNTRDSNEKLIEQIDINYSNAQMTNEVGQVLGECTKTEDILASVTRIMEKRLSYDRGIILLANRDRTRLEMKAGYGYAPDRVESFNQLSFSLNEQESKGVFVNSFREQRPFLINDLKDIEGQLSPRSLNIARELDSKSFICCPIVCEETSIGILAVDNVKTKKPLVQSDINLLMGVASVIAISIRNCELVEARLRQFHSVLHILAASIDARDSLTAGHSEKVTEYALAICNELDLPSEYCEVIRVASLLHDYGKIGVPDTILKKPGRLTREEYEVVKTHVDKTSEILSQINFEGIYRDVPEIVSAHHEKIDGSGYPRGIRGDAIPLGSRIISVADYFEAVTSKRHYRDPMPVHEAFDLLRQESVSHLEGRIVEALIAWYTRSAPAGPLDEELSRKTGGGLFVTPL